VSGSREPELTSEQRDALAIGVAQFNQGLYFECHETLEDVWRVFKGPSRDFFQALIQVSVGFHHLERGNQLGALRTFARALGRFEPYPAHYLGFDVAEERNRIAELLGASAEDAAAPVQRAAARLEGRYGLGATGAGTIRRPERRPIWSYNPSLE